MKGIDVQVRSKEETRIDQNLVVGKNMARLLTDSEIKAVSGGDSQPTTPGHSPGVGHSRGGK
ncbi:hypothetical protein [Ralstonia syzygii]|uniref:Uncharacterized protein n=1 Tax=Ralstonia syzygii R24 TaxID=907261 RepID=G3A9U0_9RALS|nr:hypothetical protein [Ralstonia syzygii]CCA88060.1 hypothetical protein RALSY_mp10599 [Ralstonia syzygii R24]